MPICAQARGDTHVHVTTELSAHADSGTSTKAVVEAFVPIARVFAAVPVATLEVQNGVLGNAVPPKVIVHVATLPVPTVTLPANGVLPVVTAGDPPPHEDTLGVASTLIREPIVWPLFWTLKIPSVVHAIDPSVVDPIRLVVAANTPSPDVILLAPAVESPPATVVAPVMLTGPIMVTVPT